MHISDGILEPQWIILWWIIAIAFIAVGVVQIRQKVKDDPKYMPVLALMGAAVLVISVWHIPVPVTGSSSHPCGTPMAAIIVGPFPVAVISAIALFFQTFVGHGGITTIGANDFSMGIVGAFTGFGTWVALRKFGVSIFWAAGMARIHRRHLHLCYNSISAGVVASSGSAVSLLGYLFAGICANTTPDCDNGVRVYRAYHTLHRGSAA